MDSEELRKAIAGPLGVLFWTIVLLLWRKKAASSDAEKSGRLREKAYFLGGKVRRAWDLLTKRSTGIQTLPYRSKEWDRLPNGRSDRASSSNDGRH